MFLALGAQFFSTSSFATTACTLRLHPTVEVELESGIELSKSLVYKTRIVKLLETKGYTVYHSNNAESNGARNSLSSIHIFSKRNPVSWQDSYSSIYDIRFNGHKRVKINDHISLKNSQRGLISFVDSLVPVCPGKIRSKLP